MEKILYIITPSRLLGCFTEFIIHKRDLGFTVNTYMIENIGQGTFNDIKAFLDNETNKIQGEYYVLLGGNIKSVPTKVTRGGLYLDAAYAVSSNPKQWRSIGRFPTNNENEMKAFCSAVIRYESQYVPNQDHLLMIAATNLNIAKSKLITAHIKKAKIGFSEMYTDQNSKMEIINQIHSNANSFINFMGHGSRDVWVLKVLQGAGTYEYIQYDDIPTFTPQPVHILSWACNTANLEMNDCLGITFLKKGALSFWGSCGVTWGEDNRNMADKFWHIYISDNRPQHLGEIYLKVYKQCTKLEGWERYMLLGDPSLKIR